MAKFETKELTGSVLVCGLPLKVRWSTDKDGPELFIWGPCSAEQAHGILDELPENTLPSKAELHAALVGLVQAFESGLVQTRHEALLTAQALLARQAQQAVEALP